VRAIVSLLVFGLLLTHAAPVRSGEPAPSELPVWLDIKQLERDVPNSEPGRCYVLAWCAEEWTFMGAQRRSERCLVLRAPTKADPE
jgi:hypothetical protein